MRIVILMISGILLTGSCKVNKNNTTANPETRRQERQKVYRLQKTEQAAEYQSSATLHHDLRHTWLSLRFDYSKQHVLGKAVLTLEPHFYPTDSLHIDARQFLLHRVALLNGNDTSDLKYQYDDEVIAIHLGKIYRARETIRIYIDYTARPNETNRKGSAAITDAKGLYFINPLGKEKDKPRQIWSQGETQSNSCWFPTLDVPNQKTTLDILLRVDQKDQTLSNGELIMSKDHSDGTRTDHWKQSLPHAPYLTMIAIGQFEVVKDYWRDKMEVNYYVEPEFKPFARLIFGHTPEMIEFFSKRLGVDYPWEKFSQIVVRDFVSGAMENTTAVIHFEPLQHDARAHLDNTYEDVISHELFHHWFGDLVTCESWSNIPLNESFATYGEYLWNEYKYGRMYADRLLDDKLNAYLGSSNHTERIPIRYKYRNREDMFDEVSYQKGGRILHMLRKHIGDEAFFRSLQLYLTRHQFSTAEIHQLRLAFEEVTGRDLQPFFNQWFLQSGHPKLTFSYVFSNDRKNVQLEISQTQDTSRYGIYNLPMEVDVYSHGQVKRQTITLSKTKQQFSFSANEPIDLINPDAEKMLVAEVRDLKSKSELAFQFVNAPLYADKWFALRAYTGDSTIIPDSTLLSMASYALDHPFFGVRSLGVLILSGATEQQLQPFEFRLKQLCRNDSASEIRRDIIALLRDQNASLFEQVFEERINDSSYQVASAALVALYQANPNKAMQNAALLENCKNGELLSAVSDIYAQNGDSTRYRFFVPAIERAGNHRFSVLQDYWEFTMMQMPLMQLCCLNDLLLFHQSADGYARYINQQLALQMKKQHESLMTELNVQQKKQKSGSAPFNRLQTAKDDLQQVIRALENFDLPAVPKN